MPVVVQCEGAGRRPESEGVGAAVVAVAAFEVTVGQEGELALVVE